MTRSARPLEEVNLIKARILDSALEIIVDEGFEKLSMRKIGKKAGMTTANLYNYYKNKDELYNHMVIQGYTLLEQELLKAVENESNPLQRIMNIIESYIKFGLEQQNYYYLMYTMHSPKYLDYVGTDHEEIATDEKELSDGVLQFVISIISDFTKDHAGYQGVEIEILAVQLWSQLHGLISLNNNGNLIEVDKNTHRIISGIVKNIETTLTRGFLSC